MRHVLFLLLVLLALLWWTPPVCAQPPAGDPVRDQLVRDLLRHYEKHPDDPLFFQQTTTVKSAQGAGASLRAAGDKTDIKGFKADAPSAGIGEGGPSASGGDTQAEGISAFAQKAQSPWLWVGLLFLAAGVYFDFFYKNPAKPGQRGDRQHASVCFAIGACLVTVALVPGWAWIVLGLGAAALAVGYCYMAVTHPLMTAALTRKFQRAQSFGEAVVEAVETMRPELASEFKSALLSTPGATEEDRRVYREIKASDFPERAHL